jgi:hypothetical protein
MHYFVFVYSRDPNPPIYFCSFNQYGYRSSLLSFLIPRLSCEQIKNAELKSLGLFFQSKYGKLQLLTSVINYKSNSRGCVF